VLPAFQVRGQGPPLLLIAGTGFAGATWPERMLELLAAERTVIWFDARGTGRTPGTPGPYSTREFAADALELLGHLGLEPAAVLGHSMGGRVAQWMAIDAPGAVRCLVLAATGPGPFRPGETASSGVPLAQALGLARLGYERYAVEHIRETFFTPEAARSEAADRLVEVWLQTRPSLEDFLKHVVARQEHRTTELLDRITRPALVLVGDRDTFAGGHGSHLEQSRYLAAHLPDADYREVPGAAHGLFWEATERSVGAVLEWLRARDGAGQPLRAGT
jgi:pimeloyl-ACP methyl ester carboxylesterase